MKPKLTAKQSAFVREYLIDLNATQAAIRAGYSERTAYSQGQRLLKNVEIQQAVTDAMAAAAKEASITVQDVLTGLHREANHRGFDSTHSARVSAWAHLGKHLGMFVERVDHTSKGEAMPGLVQIYIPSNGRDELEEAAEVIESS